MLTEEERGRLVENLAKHLKDAQEFIQKKMVHNFSQVDPEYGRRVNEALQKYKAASAVSYVW